MVSLHEKRGLKMAISREKATIDEALKTARAGYLAALHAAHDDILTRDASATRITAVLNRARMEFKPRSDDPFNYDRIDFMTGATQAVRDILDEVVCPPLSIAVEDDLVFAADLFVKSGAGRSLIEDVRTHGVSAMAF